MNAVGRRDAAARILIAVAVGLLCYLFPAMGAALVAGVSTAFVRPGRA